MGLLTPRGYKRSKTKNMVYPSTSDLFLSTIGGLPISYVDSGNVLKDSNVFSVINRISSDIASAHFKTESASAKRRLENPSDLISRFSFWQGVMIQLALAGNAYVPLVGNNLEHVPPSDVQINYLPGNTGIIYTIQESNDRPKMQLTADQMLHFRLMPDPNYRYLIGKSPLESLGNTLTIAQKTTDSNLKTLNNQINSAGKLKISNFIDTGEDLEDARAMFEKANTGANAGRLMTLPEGFDYEPFEMKADVFKALNENASFSADQISTAFGIPSDMLGGGSSTESQHSNSDQIKSLYLSNLNTYTNPLLDELKLKLNVPDLDLDIKNMLDVDDSMLINQVSSLAKAGALSPNQVQFLLQRSGFLPQNLPDYEPQVEGGESNDD
ncbi:phage portal protein [Lactiplantibacillus plantarum]|uniref:Phage portal protein n=1 Tax=Lactiplantibacillus plantarum TaxID=1590 RepID=A0AAX1K7Y9_LACPN|nr:phage portal protein [Lactiplantibacillus plantarum]QQM59978.1 phage portal protein [Lactiplantibacillus plantarum]